MEIESVVQKYKEQWSSLQTHITSKFNLMRQFLTEEEQRFVRELGEEEERILETMEKNLREIQENLNIIQENLSKLHELKEQKRRSDIYKGGN
ncbi:nuclear factor 7, ovary-like isoform X2 [Heterodontus francisci]